MIININVTVLEKNDSKTKFTEHKLIQNKMKKFIIPILILSFIGIYINVNSEKPNVFFTIIGVAVIVYGMIKLSSKIESNHKDEDDE